MFSISNDSNVTLRIYRWNEFNTKNTYIGPAI